VNTNLQKNPEGQAFGCRVINHVIDRSKHECFAAWEVLQ